MIETSEVRYGLTTIPYAIRRSGREKTVALTVEGSGRLVVTAPGGVPIARLNGIVRAKARWVLRRIRRASDLPPPPSEREFVTGEAVRYLGRQYRLKVLDAGQRSLSRLWAGWYELPVRAELRGRVRPSEVRRRLAESLKDRAARYLPERLADMCRRLRVEPPGVALRDQAKRWGSCDRHGVLRINWRIIQAPSPLIDYVLVHELAHLQHRGHDRAFWRLVGQWMPDYDARRTRLRELGPSLVW